jgi:hypothetical protein
MEVMETQMEQTVMEAVVVVLLAHTVFQVKVVTDRLQGLMQQDLVLAAAVVVGVQAEETGQQVTYL